MLDSQGDGEGMASSGSGMGFKLQLSSYPVYANRINPVDEILASFKSMMAFYPEQTQVI